MQSQFARNILMSRNSYGIVLIGDCGSGKSSLLVAHMSGKPPATQPSSTIGMSWYNISPAVGRSKAISCWDTAGQERYRSLIPMYTRNATALVFLSPAGNRTNKSSTPERLREAIRGSNELLHVALVISKCDLDINCDSVLSELKEVVETAAQHRDIKITTHYTTCFKPSTCSDVFNSCIASIDAYDKVVQSKKDTSRIEVVSHSTSHRSPCC